MSPTATTNAAGRRIHRAWLVAAVTFLVLVASAAFRSSVGVLILPFEQDLGWSRSAISLAVSINLVFYGVTAPFAAALMERFGIRNIAALALTLIALGTGLTLFMTEAWQLAISWGVLVGLGTGSTALVFGALVANRWFVKHRGLVMGILGAAWATGSLVFLPLISNVIDSFGWRYASFGIAVMCLALIPVVWVVIRDRPTDIGLRPYGSSAAITAEEGSTNSTHSALSAARTALSTLAFAAKTRAFWLLAGTFFICGWTTNGIISTHFVPATHDHGMGATTAAGLLAVIGIFDIIGTIGSGWLTDRINPRLLLGIYYGLRGVALIALPILLGPNIDPPLFVVMILFGLDWVATVPPTATLCRQIYGTERGTIIFGWVFAAHMIGAAFAASVSSVIREQFGDYATAWFLAGALALIAAVAALLIPRRSRAGAPT